MIEICRDNYIAASRASSGALGYAHQTNEVVPVDALIKATTFYAAIPQTILETIRKRR